MVTEIRCLCGTYPSYRAQDSYREFMVGMSQYSEMVLPTDGAALWKATTILRRRDALHAARAVRSG